MNILQSLNRAVACVQMNTPNGNQINIDLPHFENGDPDFNSIAFEAVKAVEITSEIIDALAALYCDMTAPDTDERIRTGPHVALIQTKLIDALGPDGFAVKVKTCPECEGRGEIDTHGNGMGVCPKCGGSGQRETPEDAYHNATQGV